VLNGASPGTFKQIEAGSSHTCGIATDDRVYCWGQNTLGQLGDNTTTTRTTPVAVLNGASPGTFKQISVSYYAFTCGLATDDRVYCWGRNALGQLGDGTTTQRNTPVAVLNGESSGTYLQISTGGNYACGIGANNRIYCWGAGHAGQLGDGTTISKLTPVATLNGASPGSFKQISLGYTHTCGVGTDDRVYCWGSNVYGQVGDNSTTSRNTPVSVLAGAGLTTVAAGVCTLPADCTVAAGTTWTEGANTCSAPSNVSIAHGATGGSTDATAPTTGSASWSCSNGTPTLQAGATCSAGSGPLVYKSHSMADAETITLPTGIVAGDLIALVQVSRSVSETPAYIVPPGFSLGGNGSYDGTRIRTSFKIANGTESGTTLTGMDGSIFKKKIAIVFSANATSMAQVLGGSYITPAAPGNISIDASSANAPALIFSVWGVRALQTPIVRGSAPAMDQEIIFDDSLYVGWKIYNTGMGQNFTTSMNDAGLANIRQGLYLTLD
jgi:hypothetical protein